MRNDSQQWGHVTRCWNSDDLKVRRDGSGGAWRKGVWGGTAISESVLWNRMDRNALTARPLARTSAAQRRRPFRKRPRLDRPCGIELHSSIPPPPGTPAGHFLPGANASHDRTGSWPPPASFPAADRRQNSQPAWPSMKIWPEQGGPAAAPRTVPALCRPPAPQTVTLQLRVQPVLQDLVKPESVPVDPPFSKSSAAPACCSPLQIPTQ